MQGRGHTLQQGEWAGSEAGAGHAGNAGAWLVRVLPVFIGRGGRRGKKVKESISRTKKQLNSSTHLNYSVRTVWASQAAQQGHSHTLQGQAGGIHRCTVGLQHLSHHPAATQQPPQRRAMTLFDPKASECLPCHHAVHSSTTQEQAAQSPAAPSHADGTAEVAAPRYLG